MSDDTSYGEAFIHHLQAVTGRSGFEYADLQAIKPMHQFELAAWFRVRWPEFADVVQHAPPDVAAKLCHELSAGMAVRQVFNWHLYMTIGLSLIHI